MAAATSRVVCIGEGLVVLRGRDHPEIERAEVLDRAIGGAELNVALGLASLGVPVAWASRVGEDPFGRLVVRELSRAGVEVSAVATDATRPTGLYLKDRTAGGSRMHYRRAGSAATAMDAAFLSSVPLRDLLGGCDLVHVSGITPGVLDDDAGFVAGLLAARDRHGFRLSVDLNWRPSLWERRSTDSLHRLLTGADLVLAGSDEAALLWGSADPEVVRGHLAPHAVLVLKTDAHDAVELSGAAECRVPALQVDVVEPIGAGDGFAAGYLAAALDGSPARARLRAGHLHAAGVLATAADHAPAAPSGVRARLLACSEEEWGRTRLGPHGLVPAEAVGP